MHLQQLKAQASHLALFGEGLCQLLKLNGVCNSRAAWQNVMQHGGRMVSMHAGSACATTICQPRT
jgi:hypothetical protein